jgi:hypothetical protein
MHRAREVAAGRPLPELRRQVLARLAERTAAPIQTGNAGRLTDRGVDLTALIGGRAVLGVDRQARRLADAVHAGAVAGRVALRRLADAAAADGADRADTAVNRPAAAVRDRTANASGLADAERGAASAGHGVADLIDAGAAGRPARLRGGAADAQSVGDGDADVAGGAVGVGVAGATFGALPGLARSGHADARAARPVGDAAGRAVGQLALATAAGPAVLGTGRDAATVGGAGQALALGAGATLDRLPAIAGHRPAAVGAGGRGRVRRAAGTDRVLDLAGRAADAAAAVGRDGAGRRRTAARTTLDVLLALLAVSLAGVGGDPAPPG